ncbi:MAG: GxxExxY protein [Sedimentisphaerales bacterium]|nr:GxxExxY protein [Sedimentisphaerales bacterium]
MDELTEKIIGAAIEVHSILGPGLLESICEEALCREFGIRIKATNLKRGLIINFGEKD